MSFVESLRQQAADRVGQILTQRLVAASVPGPKPERFFRLEPGSVQRTRDGYAVRVATWRHWSDASASRDVERGDVRGWRLDRLAEPSTRRRMTADQAADAVDAVEPIPEDAWVAAFHHLEHAPGLVLATIEWVRVVDGVRVDGDSIVAQVHPETRAVVSYFRKWRELRPAAAGDPVPS